jgi:hypothetical protein
VTAVGFRVSIGAAPQPTVKVTGEACAFNGTVVVVAVAIINRSISAEEIMAVRFIFLSFKLHTVPGQI